VPSTPHKTQLRESSSYPSKAASTPPNFTLSTRPYAIVKHQTKRPSSSAPTPSVPFKQSDAHHQKTISYTSSKKPSTKRKNKTSQFSSCGSHLIVTCKGRNSGRSRNPRVTPSHRCHQHDKKINTHRLGDSVEKY
jgi:hypothetical protein